MQMKSLLMAGTATGLALSLGGQALAKDKVVSSATTVVAGPTAAQVEALQTQIEAMQAQVAYMKRQIELMNEKNPFLAKAAKVTENSAHKFALESGDGQYSLSVTGRIHADVGSYVSVSPKSKITSPQNLNSGFNVRRARIGVTGKAAGDFTYQFVADVGGTTDQLTAGNAVIQAAQVGYTGFKNTIIELGYSDTFFTLDEATSSNDILFMERASPGVVATGVNAGDFRSNFGARYTGDRLWLGAYVTGPSNGQAHGVGESIGAYQRAAYQVLAEPDYTLHLGVGIDEIIKAPGANPATFTLSDRPELRIDPTSLLSTGALGTVTSSGVSHAVSGGYITDLEAAGNYKALFFQGEYLHFNIDRLGLSTASFDGGYGEVSYTLTGEAHKYNKGSGAYGGITPAHSFSMKDGYWGAWEIAARYSYIDLVDNFIAGTPIGSQPNAVNGGKQEVFTAGLNWYPNTYMRFMLNYVHADFDKANSTAASGVAAGAPVGLTSDAIALRTQVAW